VRNAKSRARRVRHAVRHPLRAVLVGHHQAVWRTGLGHGQITEIGGYVVTVNVWVITRLWGVGRGPVGMRSRLGCRGRSALNRKGRRPE
jgi:hypothetical protein